MQWLRLPVRCARLGGWFALAFGGRGLVSLKTLVVMRGCAAITLAACAIGVQAADYQYVYDELGRVVGMVAPDGSSVSYAYDAVGNITAIKNFAANAIAVSEFTPNSGPVGTVVTIHGSGFSTTPASNAVKFNGVTAAVSAATANRLTVTVPAGATTGSLTVTSPNGAVTAGTFTVAAGQIPAITTFSPTIGVAGTVVTVNGSNFQLAKEDNRLQFGVNFAPAKTATVSSLTAAVPRAAGSGKITVATPFGKTASSADFYAVPPNRTVAEIAYTGRLTVGAAAQTVTIGTAGKRALVLFDGALGQRFSLLADANTFAYGLTAEIYRPDGALMQAVGLPVGQSIVLTPLPMAGTYTVLMSPNSGDAGTAALRLIADKSGALAVNGSTAVSLGVGQNGSYSFTPVVGKGHGLALTNLVINGTGSATKQVRAELLGPNGTVLTGCTFYANDKCVFQPAYFTVAGTYVLRFDAVEPYTASFNAVFSQDAGTALTVDAAPVTATFAREGQAAVYIFNATAGQSLSLLLDAYAMDDGNAATAPNTTYLYVVLPSQQPVLSAHWGSMGIAANAPARVWDFNNLPETGTYAVGIYPSGLDKGSIRLQLKKEAAGTLALNTSTPISLGAGQNGRYSFTAQALKGYSVALSNLAFGGAITGSPYVYVQLFGPANQQLWACTAYASDHCLLPPGLFQTTGTYSLRFDPSDFATVSFNAILSQHVTASMTVDAPAATLVSTAYPGQGALVAFNATAGQNLNLLITDPALDDGNPSTPPGGWLYLVPPSQQPIVSGSIQSASLHAAGTADFTNLPETGTYLLAAYPGRLDKGSFKLQLKREATGTLAVNASTPITLSAGQNGRYTFNGQAGKGYGLALTNIVFGGASSNNVNVELRAPNGTHIASCSFSSDSKCILRPTLFTASGTYTLVLAPGGLDSTSFNAVLSQDASGSLAVNAASATTVTIARPGQAAVYTFAGTAGQNLKLHITGNTMDDGKPATSYQTYFYVLRPSDQPLGHAYWLMANVATNGGSTVLDLPNLPATGTYAIAVYPTELDKGTVNLQVKTAP
jgi:YD repeat-containing protein